MPKLKNSQFKLLILQSGLGLVLFFVWLHFIDTATISKFISRTNISILSLALVASLTGAVLRIWRWQIILNPIVKVPLKELLKLGYIQALFNYLIPIRAGDIGITYLVKKSYRLPFTKVLGTTFLNRFFDFFGTLVTASISLLVLTYLDRKFLLTALAVSAVLITTTFLLIVVLKQTTKARVFANELFCLIPENLFKDKLVGYTKEFTNGLVVLKDSNKFVLILSLLSALAVMSDGLFLYFIFLSFGFNVGLPIILLSVSIFTLSFLIPAAPLYIGSTELAGSILFVVLLGLSKNEAGSITVFWHLLNSLLVISFGLLALWLLRLKKT